MPETLPLTSPSIGTGTGTGVENRDEDTPMFRVVLLDDDEHTYEYVVEMLCTIFFLSAETAYRNACEVDALGRTVVIICEREQAEFGRDQIHAYGADPRMAVSKGSMSAVVEPVQG
jgi:ATP-dependent Clp protease adaptor protein ClpS